MELPVQRLLRPIARRMLATRAAEAFALAGAGAAGVSGALMVAAILAGPHPAWATALALLPLASLLLVLPAGPLRRLVDRWHLPAAVCRAIAAISAAASLAGLVLIHAPAIGRAPHWAIPLVLVPLGGLVAAAAEVLRGFPLRRVALYLDARAGLGELLTTALELEGGGPETLLAPVVRGEAVAALRRLRPQGMRFWQRTRATPGVLGLALLACGVLALVPAQARPGQRREQAWREARAVLAGDLQREADELASQTGPAETTPALTRQAEGLRLVARRLREGELPPREAVRELSRLQEEMLAAQLREPASAGSLAKAVNNVERVRSAIEKLGSVPGFAGGDGRGEGDGQADATAGGAGETAPRVPGAQPPDAPLGEGPTAVPAAGAARAEAPWHRVYDPRLVGKVSPAEASPGEAYSPPAGTVGAAEGYVGYDAAWSAARRRAEQAVRGQGVPSRYRGLVQGYFAAAGASSR